MLSASNQACELAEEMARTYPNTPRYKLALADNLRNHSSRQLAAKLPAHAALDRSASLYEGLVKSYPGVNQYRLGVLRVRLQEIFLARADGDCSAADKAARRALDQTSALTQDPADDDSLAITANCQLCLALTFLDCHRREEAERAIQTAESIIRRIKTGRSRPSVQPGLRPGSTQRSDRLPWRPRRAARSRDERAATRRHTGVH